jgi:Indole-3-glycerol phosphate synthase
MKGTILEKIIDIKRGRVRTLKQHANIPKLMADARAARAKAGEHRFRNALSDLARINLIAEFKRASPSKGVINDRLDPIPAAVSYKNGGACAISVLTEEDFFYGSLDDLRVIRDTVDLPILRKDFFIDEFQIYEAAEAGADAILLIVAVLTEGKLMNFLQLAQDGLGMDALVEVHTWSEMEMAKRIGANIIGVNNRDLKTFKVSLDVSRELIQQKPANALMIAESGISTKDEIVELRTLGFDGFLVGETLMRAGDAKETLEALM